MAVEDEPEDRPEISRRDLFGRWMRGLGRAAVDMVDHVPGPLGGLVGPGPGELDLLRQMDEILAHDAGQLAGDPPPDPGPASDPPTDPHPDEP